MIQFTTLNFIFYTIFFVLVGIMVGYAISKIQENKEKKTDRKNGEDLKVGGIYGCTKHSLDEDNPFKDYEQYLYVILILDKMISPSNGKMYYKYVHINKEELIPFQHYKKCDIHSEKFNYIHFQSLKYIKSIDLNTIKFE